VRARASFAASGRGVRARRAGAGELCSRRARRAGARCRRAGVRLPPRAGGGWGRRTVSSGGGPAGRRLSWCGPCLGRQHFRCRRWWPRTGTSTLGFRCPRRWRAEWRPGRAGGEGWRMCYALGCNGKFGAGTESECVIDWWRGTILMSMKYSLHFLLGLGRGTESTESPCMVGFGIGCLQIALGTEEEESARTAHS
jgi:hypothetical protein